MTEWQARQPEAEKIEPPTPAEYEDMKADLMSLGDPSIRLE